VNTKNTPSESPKGCDIITSSIKDVIDFVRTAPLGIGLSVVTLTLSISSDDAGAMLLSLGYLIPSSSLIVRQMHLRHRLENIINSKGYRDADFQKTLPEWCDRQTAMVVARNSGNQEKYENLYTINKKDHPDTMSFKWLPHF
jgi:hypothetical protein